MTKYLNQGLRVETTKYLHQPFRVETTTYHHQRHRMIIIITYHRQRHRRQPNTQQNQKQFPNPNANWTAAFSNASQESFITMILADNRQIEEMVAMLMNNLGTTFRSTNYDVMSNLSKRISTYDGNRGSRVAREWLGMLNSITSRQHWSDDIALETVCLWVHNKIQKQSLLCNEGTRAFWSGRSIPRYTTKWKLERAARTRS